MFIVRLPLLNLKLITERMTLLLHFNLSIKCLYKDRLTLSRKGIKLRFVHLIIRYFFFLNLVFGRIFYFQASFSQINVKVFVPTFS